MAPLCHRRGILIDPVNSDINSLNKKYDTDVYTCIEDRANINFSFSFVRNPFDRLVSAWRCAWVTRKRVSSKRWLETPISRDFTRFVKDFVVKETDFDFFRWSHVMPFTDPRMKLFNSDGEKLLSFIGKLESYQEDFNSVCDRIGISQQQLPHLNQTKHKHYTEYYDDETREIVAEKYAKDIECFGYKFGV